MRKRKIFDFFVIRVGLNAFYKRISFLYNFQGRCSFRSTPHLCFDVSGESAMVFGRVNSVVNLISHSIFAALTPSRAFCWHHHFFSNLIHLLSQSCNVVPDCHFVLNESLLTPRLSLPLVGHHSSYYSHAAPHQFD